jgi:hypothetical protein
MIESDPNRHRSRAKDGSGDPWILWHDSERVLRRESRLGVDGTRSVVLVVAPAAEHPSPTILERLAHEYGLKEELEGSWAVRPLELVLDAPIDIALPMLTSRPFAHLTTAVIATRAGFLNASHLAPVVRRHTGRTAQEWGCGAH